MPNIHVGEPDLCLFHILAMGVSTVFCAVDEPHLLYNILPLCSNNTYTHTRMHIYPLLRISLWMNGICGMFWYILMKWSCYVDLPCVGLKGKSREAAPHVYLLPRFIDNLVVGYFFDTSYQSQLRIHFGIAQ